MKLHKNLFAGSLGTAFEFYDYTLYGVFAPLFAEIFFPGGNHYIKLMLSLSVFAVSFFVRPLGALIFGLIGDKYGRKKALKLTITLMGLSTFLVGILPSYQQIGILAPILLTLLRSIQGFCAGGEHNGSAIFVIEHTEKGKKGLMGSFIYSSAVLGNLMALIIGSIVLNASMPEWAWRLPFLVSIIFAYMTYHLRQRAKETPVFLNVTSKKLPLIDFYNQYKLALIKTIIIGSYNGILIYMLSVYMNIHMINNNNYSQSYSVAVVAFTLSLLLGLIPIVGKLSDKYGYRRIMSLGCLFIILVAYFIFQWIKVGGMFVIVAQVIFAMGVSFFVGPMHAFLNELFPPLYRYRAITTCFSVGLALFGGTTPLIASSLIKMTGFQEAPAFLLIFGALIGLLVLRKL